MWIFKSSIGRKLIMSLSGLFLITFLALHGVINLLAVYDALHINGDSPTELYNEACHFMGTNLLVQIMVPVLALGFIVHIIYAFVLSAQNLKARGKDRYVIASRTKANWASKNMLLLGIIVLGLLGWHLSHFWAKMQLNEWMGQESEEGFYLVVTTFSNKIVVVGYIIWLVALWLHLNHGFWSAFQTIGWNNSIWYRRLRVIGVIVSTLLVSTFLIVAIYFGFIYGGSTAFAEPIAEAVGNTCSIHL
jgi:succinate dehydrogenase / fumarate reductase cytochrome b subunit